MAAPKPKQPPVGAAASEAKSELPSAIYDKLKPEYVQLAVVKFMVPPSQWDSSAPFIVVENCLIKDIDQRLHNDLQFGDLILSINDQTIANDSDIKANLEKVAAAAPPETEFEYSFMVKRPVAPVSATKADLPQSELQETETMKVLKAYVVLYPQSALGLKVKDIFGKVIVSTVDPAYRSICKNVFNVGDYILSINGKMILGMKEFRAAFIKIKKDEMENFKVVFKRALTPQDIATVRRWLNASKTDGYHAPVMASDVSELCTKEIQRLKAGNITVPPSIYVPPVHTVLAKDKRLNVADAPKKFDIGIEPEIVRQYLMKVPNSASGVLHQTMTMAVDEPKRAEIDL
ncbi:hypothetical protein PRIPAC_85077 [Pristionchus pacificus]|uniref:PDZ domain-containing protein n=1 Tax=Pristionchus pacificus TaxID=54126 RepID=A0A2A6CC77_PRIPA|nr:hypothetical protein PRIPAC_85077 [Pristionchus pacificus]|eukprot:PDM75784.1 PDZ domain-containing protein [Pristionchus pacificus]